MLSNLLSFGSAVSCLMLLSASAISAHASEAGGNPHSQFAGHYASGSFSLIYVDEFQGRLSIQPPYWSSRPTLAQRDRAHFYQLLPEPNQQRLVTFGDFVGGKPGEISLHGFGKDFEGLKFRRITPGHEPIGLLALAGRPREAAAKIAQAPTSELNGAGEFALRTLNSRPSTAGAMLAFLRELSELEPGGPPPKTLFARALAELMSGQRAEASNDFASVLAQQPHNDESREYLDLLNAREPLPGQHYRRLIPFKLSQLYAPPTPAEVEAVLQDWKSRDLSPGAVRIVYRASLNCAGTRYSVRILKHDNRGSLHYGALLVPEGSVGRLPSIIDVRGVDPGFSPLSLDKCTTLLRTLGDQAGHFAVLVPGMNGHELRLKGKSFKSAGDASDSWDGGTDSVLSFLNASLAVEPRLEKNKIAIHGHSRGGGVAMLAAIRDKRISLVLSRAGPVDWFEAMQPLDGISWADSVRTALKDGHAPAPNTRAAQHYDTFIDRIVERGETLADARHRMIASSAYYFAERLPETHAFYGREDTSVPVRNADFLALRLNLAGRLRQGSTVEIYDNVGHDTDWWRSAVVIRHALRRWQTRDR